MVRTVRRLRAESVRFLLIDMQERLLPHIDGCDEIRNNAAKLLAAARLLDIPLFYTEQYPKGIGGTVPELLKSFPRGAARFEKTHFSCLDEPGFREFLGLGSAETVTVVCGIEAHICVLTTVMDMLDEGLGVAVISDAVGSRDSRNRDVALSSMRHAGALVMPLESVVYQLLGRAGTERFKAMLPFFRN